MSGTTRNNTQKHDFYKTPSWCTEKLIPLINWSLIKTYHEPCYGQGDIFDLIPIDNKSFSEIEMGKDYLIGEVLDVDLVLTNPPFKSAVEFIERAISHSKTVIMLLKLDLMGSAARKEFWSKNPPSNLIVMNERPSFTGDGKSDGCVYAWFVWGENILINNKPIQWISKI